MDTRIAVAGDIHGDIERLLRRATGLRADAVLQVGDFETVRGPEDLERITGPRRYRKLGDFGFYWRRERRVPMPIYFIGGNHEVYSGHLEHCHQGAEVAPGIHYLGHTGVAEIAGKRVAWLSRIYNSAAFDDPAQQPARRRSLKPFTYYRRSDVEDLDLLMMDAGSVDVLLLHDWPRYVGRPGDGPVHRRVNPVLQCDETYDLIVRHQPARVFCGHMHWPLSARIGQTRVECLAHIDHEASVQLVPAGL